MQKIGAALLLTVAVACNSKQTATSMPNVSNPPATSAGSTGTGAPLPATESAVAPEVNPPGDIPDTQAFVNFSSAAGGYSFDVPEGWARTESGSSVTFVSKLDGLRMDVTPSSSAPTASSARASVVSQIQSHARAVTVTSVSDVNLPSGKTVLIKYTSNSDPNPVTHKQVRLENQAYLYFRNGKLATLTLWAPEGADNADQWNRMSKSFRWM